MASAASIVSLLLLLNGADNNNTTDVCSNTVVLIFAKHLMGSFAFVYQASNGICHDSHQYTMCRIGENASSRTMYFYWHVIEFRIYNILSEEMETQANLIVIAQHCKS